MVKTEIITIVAMTTVTLNDFHQNFLLLCIIFYLNCKKQHFLENIQLKVKIV